jgi:hypothetical protein
MPLSLSNPSPQAAFGRRDPARLSRCGMRRAWSEAAAWVGNRATPRYCKRLSGRLVRSKHQRVSWT